MQHKPQFLTIAFRTLLPAAIARLATAILSVLIVTYTIAAPAQDFKVLYNFTGGRDGGQPFAGVTVGAPGNVYGTTSAGGNGYGGVYKLTNKNGHWVFTPLYNFTGGDDGAEPTARVIFGPDGALYGTTSDGGMGSEGTVFRLAPYPTVCKNALCGWQETVLHAFMGGDDGAGPGLGDLLFDQQDNLYGTTVNGGDSSCDYAGMGCGTVYELTPSSGIWTESVLYRFTDNGWDGAYPQAGVILDPSGNLYGTTEAGGFWRSRCGGLNGGCGTVFELTPSGVAWHETTLYSFSDGADGAYPAAGLIFDLYGNLFGATTGGPSGNGGTIFELAPLPLSGWKFSLLDSFAGSPGPESSLAMDAAGNLYGTNGAGAYGFGSVFKLTYSGGVWIQTNLHDFTGGSDGNYPAGGVALDNNGNLFGTTYYGGAYYNGVVWEITPY